ncbi:MAG: hypothetical protein ACE5L6_01440 [Candidatus Bathyarchaeia archaeon]
MCIESISPPENVPMFAEADYTGNVLENPSSDYELAEGDCSCRRIRGKALVRI